MLEGSSEGERGAGSTGGGGGRGGSPPASREDSSLDIKASVRGACNHNTDST